MKKIIDGKEFEDVSDTGISGETVASPKKENSGVGKFFSTLVLLIAIGGVAASFYYYNKYQTLKKNPDAEVQKQIQSTVADISKLMVLPTDETPTMATVQDVEGLKSQLFFKNAANGDILLVYSNEKKAVLYRPSTNKVIEVGPVYTTPSTDGTIAPQANEQAPTAVLDDASQTVKLKIAYYNGTKVVGLSSQAEKLIEQSYSGYQTSTLTNASKRDYTETLVIDLSGTHSQEATAVATLLGGKVSALPEGEVIPDADLLIISGQ